MITLRVEITDYNKKLNTCTAKLQNENIIQLDPFVGCALELLDEDYENDKGFELIGDIYLLTEYTVYRDCVVPSEGGMIKL